MRKSRLKLSILHFRILVLLVVLSVAAFLRLYHLDTDPPAPYWEETALGYDAFSIAKTGKDFHGNPYPLLAFPSFGDYKPSGYFYAEVPFIDVLGLNLLAVRLPSALAGIIAVGVIYLIGRELFGSQTGLIASSLLAISPWSLQFSRGGWEVNLALTCVMVGALLLLVARRNIWVLPVSVLFFGFSMYTYHAARVYAPLIGMLGGTLLLRQWWAKKTDLKPKILSFVVSLMLALLCVAPLILNLKSNTVSSRFDATSIFSDPEPVLDSNAQIAAHGGTRMARILYHRDWFYGALILQGFIKHFSLGFLFVRGDGNLRHGTVAFGLFYILDVVFMLISLVYALRNKDKRILILVICILFAAVAPSLVTPTPHALRFLFALPAFTLLIAYGISKVPRRGLWLIGCIYLFFVSSYFFYYHTQYPVKAASDWQYGYRQMYEILTKNKQVGEPVFVTREQGRPSMYYLFYTAYDPRQIQEAGPTLPKDQLELLRVGDYHFVDVLPGGKGLYASSPNKVDSKAHIIDSVKNLDGQVIWVIWRRN